MRILITGATGFVGQAILKTLRERGHHVVLLVRNHRSSRLREIGPCFAAEIHLGNVLDPDSLRNACAGVDTVIHLVGIISETGQQTFERVHTLGTRNMVAAARQFGVKRFVHMSALGTRPNAVARYHQSKWAAEEIVRQSELAWTIFRPSIIYGPDDGFVNLFSRIIRVSPVIPIVGDGRTVFQPVSVTVVAAAFAGAVVEPRSIGQTYDLAGPETLTLNEMVDAILEVLCRKRIRLHLPLALARWQAVALELLFDGLLHRAPPLNRDQVLMLQENNLGDPAPANALFGLKPASFAEGIASYLSRS